jgi:hypothetical protein
MQSADDGAELDFVGELDLVDEKADASGLDPTSYGRLSQVRHNRR